MKHKYLEDTYMLANSGVGTVLLLKVEDNVGYIWGFTSKKWVVYPDACGYSLGFEGCIERVTKEKMEEVIEAYTKALNL